MGRSKESSLWDATCWNSCKRNCRPARGRSGVITNWADIHRSPLPREENALLESLNLREPFVVLYAGSMGPLNNLDAVLISPKNCGRIRNSLFS